LPIQPREHFWNVDQVILFYALAGVASALFACLTVRMARRWAAGRRPKRPGRREPWAADVLLNAGVFKGDLLGGLAHLLVLWGFVVLFIGTVLLTIDHYLVTFLTGRVYLAYSLVLDLFGAAFVLSLLWLLLRRHVLRRGRMHSEEPEDSLLILLLLAVGVTGFLVEGFRLAETRPAGDDWSPIGALFASLAPAGARAAHRVAWWVHAGLSLLLIAWLPWGKLRHALVSPLQRIRAGLTPSLRTAEEREEEETAFAAHELLASDACMWCNRCETVCPSHGVGEDLSPRQVVKDLRRAEPTAEGRRTASPDEVPWLCTGCGACRVACPVSIDGRDLILETRALLVEGGTNVPDQIARALESVAKQGNPWEGKRSKRAAWAEGLELKDASKGDEAPLLWFVGSTLAFDTRCQDVARATAAALSAAGVDFAIDGRKARSSGDLAASCGEHGLHEMMIEENAAFLGETGAKEIVASSPHDLHALSGYREMIPLLPDATGSMLPVTHVTEVLAARIREGKLAFGNGAGKTVTYHDPCFLGRHRGVYDAPREVLRALPGTRLVEMADRRESSWCCGGGGGRMWFEPERTGGLKMSERRIRQAADTGAEILAVACPYCLIQFEDAVKTAGLADRLRVADVTELVQEACRK